MEKILKVELDKYKHLIDTFVAISEADKVMVLYKLLFYIDQSSSNLLLKHFELKYQNINSLNCKYVISTNFGLNSNIICQIQHFMESYQNISDVHLLDQIQNIFQCIYQQVEPEMLNGFTEDFLKFSEVNNKKFKIIVNLKTLIPYLKPQETLQRKFYLFIIRNMFQNSNDLWEFGFDSMKCLLSTSYILKIIENIKMIVLYISMLSHIPNDEKNECTQWYTYLINLQNNFECRKNFEEKVKSFHSKEIASRSFECNNSNLLRQSSNLWQTSVLRSYTDAFTEENETYQIKPNNLTNNYSNVTNLLVWLKHLRLHKYHSLLKTLDYKSLMTIDDDWLKSQKLSYSGEINNVLIQLTDICKTPMPLIDTSNDENISNTIFDLLEIILGRHGPLAEFGFNDKLNKIIIILNICLGNKAFDSGKMAMLYKWKTMLKSMISSKLFYNLNKNIDFKKSKMNFIKMPLRRSNTDTTPYNFKSVNIFEKNENKDNFKQKKHLLAIRTKSAQTPNQQTNNYDYSLFDEYSEDEDIHKLCLNMTNNALNSSESSDNNN
ncbi:hypothetical protein A3Q56_03949 [Intoshia linei]|uniref:Uncharacterized protein n=1 Tax=Intoshia linei TaxID=1819745 RepID=A0A177B3W8_9BILA|nr:hypothetical protein A3Q56_03949 [Intoshia linei]